MPTNPTQFHRTSVSLRLALHRRLKAARKIFRRHGVIWSESELLSRLAKAMLQKWRDNGAWTQSARRYNADGPRYVVRPWQVDKNLHGLLWQRTLHSGESVSRFMDYALRVFLPRLLEFYLKSHLAMSDWSRRNYQYWERRYAKRRPTPPFFINYSKTTSLNKNGNLKTLQEATIIPKENLSSGEIFYATRFLV